MRRAGGVGAESSIACLLLGAWSGNSTRPLQTLAQLLTLLPTRTWAGETVCILDKPPSRVLPPRLLVCPNVCALCMPCIAYRRPGRPWECTNLATCTFKCCMWLCFPRTRSLGCEDLHRNHRCRCRAVPASPRTNRRRTEPSKSKPALRTHRGPCLGRGMLLQTTGVVSLRLLLAT